MHPATTPGQSPLPLAKGALVTGDLANELRASAERVGEALAQEVPRDDEARAPGLSGGRMGSAVVLANLGALLHRPAWLDLARQQWTIALDALGDLRIAPGLYSGFAGVAWGSAHLETHFFPDDGLDYEEIDEAMRQWLTVEGPRDYDLIEGWVGAGVYALQRWPDESARGLVRAIVERLTQDAIYIEDGTTWKTPVELLPPHQQLVAPDGYYNLGLAHGVPGVVAFLAQVHRVGELESIGILESAVRWLRRQRLETTSGLCYRSWETDPATDATSRLGWCYGDLGVGAALAVAGACTERKDWLGEGVDLVRAAARLDPETYLVRDHGLCHGFAGVAHALHRVYRVCGDEDLADLARSWFALTLDRRVPETGIDGYTSWRARNPSAPQSEWEFGHVRDAGYLTGAGGVALALASAGSERFAEWDRPLLLSFPDGGAS